VENCSNSAHVKGFTARLFKEAIGRELNLGDKIDPAFGLSPVSVVKDVLLAKALRSSQPQMIKVEKLEAEMQLLHLCRHAAELLKIACIR
jgi:hypothetical protein